MKLCAILWFTVICFMEIYSQDPEQTLSETFPDPLPIDQDMPIFLQFGTKSSNDKLLFKKLYQKSARFLMRREETVQYAVPASSVAQIKAIIIYNYYKSGKAMLASGGIGQNYVNILLRSKRGQGYSFAVEIYGH